MASCLIHMGHGCECLEPFWQGPSIMGFKENGIPIYGPIVTLSKKETDLAFSKNLIRHQNMLEKCR